MINGLSPEPCVTEHGDTCFGSKGQWIVHLNRWNQISLNMVVQVQNWH